MKVIYIAACLEYCFVLQRMVSSLLLILLQLSDVFHQNEI